MKSIAVEGDGVDCYPPPLLMSELVFIEKIIIFYVCLVYICSMKFMYRLYEFYETLCWTGGLEFWRVYWKRLMWIPESGEGYY